MGFYSGLINQITSIIVEAVNANVSALSKALNPVFYSMVTLYFAWWGYKLLFGESENIMKDFFWKVFRVGLIAFIALEISNYNKLITHLFIGGGDMQNLGDWISGIFVDSTKMVGANALDTIMDNTYEIVNKLNESLTWRQFPQEILVWLMYAFIGFLCLYSCFLMIMSKVALAILIGVGPLFIIGTLFESTKRFFDSWLQQVLNYLMLLILLNVALSLIFNIFETLLNSTLEMGSFSLERVAQVMILSYIFWLVIQQVPTIASALTGGFALSDGGMGGRMGGLIKSATGQNLLSKGLGKAQGSLWNKASRGFRASSQAKDTLKHREKLKALQQK